MTKMRLRRLKNRKYKIIEDRIYKHMKRDTAILFLLLCDADLEASDLMWAMIEIAGLFFVLSICSLKM